MRNCPLKVVISPIEPQYASEMKDGPFILECDKARSRGAGLQAAQLQRKPLLVHALSQWPLMFYDRADAGLRLAKRLIGYTNRDDLTVLGLPRGGVPVAFEIARQLHAPLDILLVRKVGVPGQPELAMGAIASGGITILDHQLIRHFNIGEQELASILAKEEEELRHREHLYKHVHRDDVIKDRCVIVVDDGVATGSSMLAAIRLLRSQKPAKIIVAVPVAPPHAEREIRMVVDEWICLIVSDYFPAVGFFYRDFSQVGDEEVRSLLSHSTHWIKSVPSLRHES